MNIKYYCRKNDCAAEEKKPYVLEIPDRLIDGSNIAEMFCPHCLSKLVRSNSTYEKETAKP